jgi:predicted ester cyclase
MGILASGKKMQIRMFTIYRVVQSKIVEDWLLVDRWVSFNKFELSRT